MKKFLIIIGLAFSVAGCAQLQAIGNGVSLATASVTNPVTKTKEAQIELAFDTAIEVLKTYKRACVAGSADVNCKANIRAIQVYTRQVGPMINQLRRFVDTNDQINAIVVYNQLTDLYANFKTAAANVGVNVGG
jgi:PBP1b-binding outer membrane lipoprotein LpoB